VEGKESEGPQVTVEQGPPQSLATPLGIIVFKLALVLTEISERVCGIICV